MSFDTGLTYNPLPYNILDKNNANNRGALLPSFQYKQRKIVWLNTAYATSSISSGTTYYEFTFDIRPFQLFNQTKLKVISYVTNENTAKPSIIKLKNLQYDNNSTYNTDKEGFATLFASHSGATGMDHNLEYSLSLIPQLVNSIVIGVTSSFTDRNAGITISGGGSGHFILALLFENDDLVIDDASSIYK
jgi:hypothetical protein